MSARAWSVLLLAFGLFACSGTSSGNPSDGAGDGPDVAPRGALLARSDLPRETDPELAAGDTEAFGSGNRAFAFELYAELDQAMPEQNLFFSPFSISTALAMTYAGAEGETESEMREVMHFDLDEPALHAAFNATDLALAERPDQLADEASGQGFELSIVNQAWGQQGYEFEAPYLDVLAQHYGAGLYLVEFGDSGPTRVLINDWVAEQTMDRVMDLLPEGALTSDTRLVLTNAIYFKANWLMQFDPDASEDGPFMAPAGMRTVPMMRAQLRTGYGEGEGYRALELPYLSPNVRMLLLLPTETSLDALIAGLSTERFDAIRSSLESYDVTLGLPRFSFESERKLGAPLQALGMTRAFGDADFSGINGGREPIWIDEVYHKAFVAVDEEGTEAAAATAVVVVTESAHPSTEIDFDRPFVFLIYDEPTGQILFLGHLHDPG